VKAKSKLFIILTVVVITLAIIAVLLLMPKNIKLDSMTKPSSALSNIINFGIPTRTTEDGLWVYNDCVNFYDIPIDSFEVYMDDTSETAYRIVMNANTYYDTTDILAHFCEKEKALLSDRYIYENIQIIAVDYCETQGLGWFVINISED